MIRGFVWMASHFTHKLAERAFRRIGPSATTGIGVVFLGGIRAYGAAARINEAVWDLVAMDGTESPTSRTGH